MVRSVNVLIHDCVGRTLLQLRDSSTATFPLQWGFWGGAMDSGDISPEACAAREVREELALVASAEDFELVGTRRSSRGEAQLFRLKRPLEWGSFRVLEGAGAAFLWRQELTVLPLSKPVSEHLQMTPSLFPGKPSQYQPAFT